MTPEALAKRRQTSREKTAGTNKMTCPNCGKREVGRFELLCETCISRKTPSQIPNPDTEFAGISSVETPIDVPLTDTCSVCRQPVINGKWHNHAAE
jgi:predicted RNA-binding Zn-ribbon protein involved in translation (DUF1610 family)